MSKFITGKELEETVSSIIWKAEKTLLIVSPYIKLDTYFRKLFDHHASNPELHIIIVFGKNEGEVRKSMNKDDFEFFKKFMNISIIHAPNLHAKYYGNERCGVITSINLYDHSFKNNIEFGVYQELSFLDKFTSSVDNAAWQACEDIARTNDVVFIKRPVFQPAKIYIPFSSKHYVKSDVLHDSTEYYYTGRIGVKKTTQKLGDFATELELGTSKSEMPTRESIAPKVEPAMGYCIRTGVKIRFNPKQPMSVEAWKVWNQYGNMDFPEQYCHKTGKPSHGKTSMRKPIL